MPETCRVTGCKSNWGHFQASSAPYPQYCHQISQLLYGRMNSVSISIKAIYHEYLNEVFDLTPVAFQCALAAYLITEFKKEGHTGEEAKR